MYYIWWKQFNALPLAGGISAQPYSFTVKVGIVQRLESFWEEQNRKRDEATDKMRSKGRGRGRGVM